MNRTYNYTLLSTLLIGLCALFIAYTQQAHAQSTFDCSSTTLPQAECESLVDFYNATNGDDWTDSTNWLETDPCQGWNGVICLEGSVQLLTLANNNLTGSLADWTPTLDKLFLFVISENDISGAIPSSIGELPALNTFTADQNNFSGELPASFGGTAVNNLGLSGNSELSGELPSSFANTEWVFFNFNDTGICQPSDLTLNGTTTGASCPDELVPTPTPPTETPVEGTDPNCDGRWTLLDAVMIKQFDAFIILETTDCGTIGNNEFIYTLECDLNGDSTCGLVEALIVQQCNAFISNPFCADIN